MSTRVRCGRSMEGYPFNPCLTEAQYAEMQDKVSSTLSGLEGELKGTYYPLKGMTKEVQQKLIDDHFLFKEGDRFLQVKLVLYVNCCLTKLKLIGCFFNFRPPTPVASGPLAVVSTTMRTRPSLCGAMRKITFVSFPCRWVATLRRCMLALSTPSMTLRSVFPSHTMIGWAS